MATQAPAAPGVAIDLFDPPRIAAHWGFLLEPLVGDHSGREGLLRYRQSAYRPRLRGATRVARLPFCWTLNAPRQTIWR